jgi:hypothetical protein
MTPALGGAELVLARKGLRVFPCKERSKEPLILGNLKRATTDERIIGSWWLSRPALNIGIATGQGSGVWVLDIDADKGGEHTLGELEAKHGALPETVESITANGRHLYFRWPEGVEIRNAQHRDDLPGIDWRGEGGFVIAPPSIHPSGRAYQWSVDSADAFADAPPWLVELVTARSSKSGNTVAPTLPATWQAVMEGEHEDSRRAGAIAKIFGHLVRKYVDPAVALALAEMFDRERNKPPLGRDEVIRICSDIAELEAERRGQ